MHLISAASDRSIGSLFASRLQRRTFAETRRLTAAHGVRCIWIRRGITYFHVKDNTPSYHLPGFTSLHPQVRFTPVRSLSSRSPVPAAYVRWTWLCVIFYRSVSIFGVGCLSQWQSACCAQR